MSLTMTTADETLWGRLGKIGRILAKFHAWQRATFPFSSGPAEELMAMYDTRRDLVPGVYHNVENQRTNQHQFLATLKKLAESTILEMVAADNPTFSRTDLYAALDELITQMGTATASVQTNTVAVSASAVSGTGNGTIVTSTKRPDGLVNENIFQEVATVEVLTDGQMQQGVPYHNEELVYRGDYAILDPLHHEWPGGSGANTKFRSISFNYNAGGGNLLFNSKFETWSGSPLAAENWDLTTGTWATNTNRTSTNPYSGTYALQIVGGATAQVLRQQFGSSSGTPLDLEPETQYAGVIWLKLDVTPAAGTWTIDLHDGTNVIADQQSTNNTSAIDVTAISISASTYYPYTFVFRTPRALPATRYFRMRASTAISSGSNMYIGGVSFGKMTETYPGGLYVSAHGGSTAWVRKDKVTLTVTNDRGGSYKSGTITGATAANPCVVTSTAHGRSNGDLVYIEAGTGSLFSDGTNGIGGRYYNVANVTANTFELAGANTTSLTYTSGGKWWKYPYLGDYQCLFDRLFDMRLKGLLLRSSGSPTLSNSGVA